MKKLLICAMLGLASAPAVAIVEPVSVGGDGRVQEIHYTPNEVFNIHAVVGNSTLIQLEEGEEVEGDNTGLGMGDAQAWSIAVRGNNLFIKPAQPLPDTNMLLVTNKRTYAFQLSTMNSANPSYVVRFVYPSPKKNIAQNIPPKPLTLRQVKTPVNTEPFYISSDINTQYFKQGANDISPTNVWDNGQFTYFRFANANDLPVVYRVLADKSEAIIDSHTENDLLVVHGVSRLYRLRHGKSEVDIFNANPTLVTTFNNTGVSKDVSKTGEVRELIGGSNE